jgi:hypothetical protein
MCELALANPHFEQCVHCKKTRVWLGTFETLTAKLHRWYLQSQQQEGQLAGKSKSSQPLTCLCLDNQQSNLGIYHKKTGKQEEPNWVRNVEFATNISSNTVDLKPQPANCS